MAIDLTQFADAINSSFDEGKYCVLATGGADGIPDVGYKGSIIVFDRDHLAYWERTRGKHLENVQEAGGAAVLYYSREPGMYLRLYGQAIVHAEGEIRDQVMARVPQKEIEFDQEKKGVAVLIRVDRLSEAFSSTTQER